MSYERDSIWSDRYSRQVRFSPVGQSGQQKLADASVLIVGVGALGTALAEHMVRAGVGRVRLADRDYVEPSNLQRQTLFDEADALAILPKAVAAANKLQKINSEVHITPYVIDVNKGNAKELTAGVQVVLDGTDNAATRFVMSDSCFQQRIPFIYGGVAGAQGMNATLIPGKTACLRCLIGVKESEGEVDTCDTVGVLAPTVSLIASLQAAEAIKLLTGNEAAMRQTWLSVDLWSFKLRESRLPQGREDCSICGKLLEEAHIHRDVGTGTAKENGTSTDLESQDDAMGSAVLCGRDTVQVSLGGKLSLERVEKHLVEMAVSLTINRYLVRALLPGGLRLVVFEDGRVLVQGTTDSHEAVAICKRYLLDLLEQ